MMKILIIHEIDWEEKVIFEPHHLAELFSIQGHEIFVIDCAQPNTNLFRKGAVTSYVNIASPSYIFVRTPFTWCSLGLASNTDNTDM